MSTHMLQKASQVQKFLVAPKNMQCFLFALLNNAAAQSTRMKHSNIATTSLAHLIFELHFDFCVSSVL